MITPAHFTPTNAPRILARTEKAAARFREQAARADLTDTQRDAVIRIAESHERIADRARKYLAAQPCTH